jgi:hypothetical protein
MSPPRAIYQELSKGHCYTIYQDPPSGKYYLMVDESICTESGETFRGEISQVFEKLKVLKKMPQKPGRFPRH